MTACPSQKTVLNMQEDSAQPQLLTKLVCDQYGGPTEAQILIIEEESALKTFFTGVNKMRKPGIGVPNVDFSKEVIVVQCNGEKNGPAQVSLEVGEMKADEIILVQKERKTEAVGTSVMTHSFCVYKMPKTKKQIRFEKLP
jgi:hypothetical protein